MALSESALVTLQDARERIGFAADDTDRDTKLEQVIDEVSRMVQRTLGRQIRPLTASDPEPADTITVAYVRGAKMIDLLPYQAWDVDSVTIAGTAVDADDFQLAPIDPALGVHDRIRLAAGVWPTSSFREVEAVIVGRFGWPTIPEDVTGWVLDLVQQRWRANHAAYADAEGIVEPMDSAPLTIPYRIRDEMERIRAVRLGSV